MLSQAIKMTIIIASQVNYFTFAITKQYETREKTIKDNKKK